MTRPRHLFDAWPTLRRRFADPRRVALFADLDGTLARIQRRPGAVRLALPMQRLLAQLARAGALVGVISGRRLEDVRICVGLPGIWYAGAHGSFLRDPANRSFSLLNRTAQAPLRRAQRCLSRSLPSLPGIIVEPKGAALALHYRTASRSDAQRARRVLECCRAEVPGLRLMAGKKVWELVPEHAADKWAAVQFILSRERRRRPAVARTLVYLGDDTTDESVFRKMHGISVAVGKPHNTAARFFLRSPVEVRQLLKRVSESWR